MPLIKTEAVVLRQKDFSEADKILTIYSMDMGKITCIAKGIKRVKSKLRGSLLPFTHNKLILYRGKNLYTVTGADTVESFIFLRKDLALIAYASYLVELLEESVPEGEKNYELFILLISSLHLLKVLDPRVAIKIFEIRLMKLLGYRPRTDSCVNCNKSANLYWFSSSQGGVLCESCRSLDPLGIFIRAGSLKMLDLLENISLKKINRLKPTPKDLAELEAVFDSYISYLLQKKLFSRVFLKCVINK